MKQKQKQYFFRLRNSFSFEKGKRVPDRRSNNPYINFVGGAEHAKEIEEKAEELDLYYTDETYDDKSPVVLGAYKRQQTIGGRTDYFLQSTEEKNAQLDEFEGWAKVRFPDIPWEYICWGGIILFCVWACSHH